LKAVREAKVETAWTAQDPEYEAGVEGFVRSVLSPTYATAFLTDMAAFVARLAPAGAVNGLAQTTLKLTVPGVPDLYQGTDLWDFSLVDPDNRRLVDFEARARWLSEGGRVADHLPSWRDGRVKLLLIATLLDLRRRAPALFARGSYIPLDVVGDHASRVLAFARVAPRPETDDNPPNASRAMIVVVPRLVWPLMQDTTVPLPQGWGSTQVLLPAEAAWSAGPWRPALDGPDAPPVQPDRHDGALPLAHLLAETPVAVLVNEA